ncbi:MAG: amidase family protein [Thaumarchaeota archaeon]|nr:amidase family protein [Nitrososphaerota archaeon]
MNEIYPVKRPLVKLRRPSPEKLRELGEQLSMTLSDEEVEGIALICDEMLKAVDQIDRIPDPSHPATYLERDPGRRPSPAEDPFNVFITKCYVKGSDSGPLLGKRVGLKDNISLRGVPMTNASRLGEHYIPNIDATVVTKLLDAGAVIVGKLNMDDFSFSGTSETSFFGSVRNPINPEYSPGGSSSASGAAVAANEVDLALGVDQGGSARTPASCCGVVAIKPTHGLVSSYGLAYMDYTIDHICPIARSVGEVAMALQVLAGYDPKDPEWVRSEIHAEKYHDLLSKSNLDISGLRVGIIKEGLAWEGADPEILECFGVATKKLEELGAKCSDVSIPSIELTPAIRIATLTHATDAMLDSCGEGYWHGGEYNPAWNVFLGRAKSTMADYLPPLLKSTLILGRYLRTEFFSVYHSKAMNLINVLGEEMEKAFEKFDVLACPTNIVKPPLLKDKIEFAEISRRGFMLSSNTQPFNMTGNPAITIPCGMRGGLPVALQLIAKHWKESTLFKASRVFEKSFNWKKL